MSPAGDFLTSDRPVGAAIRDRRRTLGLDQRRLAERAGVSRKWIIDIEQGKPRAELGLVLRTLHALGLEIRLDPGPDARARPAEAAPVIVPDIDAIIERRRAGRR